MSRQVPEGWNIVRLGDVTKAQSGGTPARGRAEYWGQTIPWMKIEDITRSDKYLETTEETLSESGLSNSSARIFPTSTVFLAMYASFGETCISRMPTSCNQAILGFYDLNGISTEYLYYVLVSLKSRWLTDVQTGSQPNLNKRLVLDKTILLPPMAVQEKIAEILGAIDIAIAARRHVTEQTRNLKRALMQELLTRGIPGRHKRFKDGPLGQIPADWTLTKFKNLIATGPQNGLYKHESSYGDGTQIVRIDDFQDGRFIRISGFKRVRVSKEERGLYSLAPGDVLLNRVNSISHLGKSAVVPSLTEPTIFESNMMRFRCDETTLTTQFAIIWLNSRLAKRQIESFAKKAVAQCSISQTDLESFDIAVPPTKEQDEIANLISACESRADHEREELCALQTIRQALSAKLLTGEIRVSLAMNTLKSVATA